MFGNMSIAQQIELPGDSTQVTLDLIPGTDYSARLRAENPDGMVITEAISFTTLAGRKWTSGSYDIDVILMCSKSLIVDDHYYNVTVT